MPSWLVCNKGRCNQGCLIVQERIFRTHEKKGWKVVIREREYPRFVWAKSICNTKHASDVHPSFSRLEILWCTNPFFRVQCKGPWGEGINFEI
jgi:hypothetical protein